MPNVLASDPLPGTRGDEARKAGLLPGRCFYRLEICQLKEGHTFPVKSTQFVFAAGTHT